MTMLTRIAPPDRLNNLLMSAFGCVVTLICSAATLPAQEPETAPASESNTAAADSPTTTQPSNQSATPDAEPDTAVERVEKAEPNKEASRKQQTANRKLKRAVDQARSLSLAFEIASEKALPTVVKILSASSKSGGDTASVLDIVGGAFDSVGSGVIVSGDGLILTNHHVIKDAKRIEVRLYDGRAFQVEETMSDPASDLAIIRLQGAQDLPVAAMGDSATMSVGQWVLAIGSPFMLDASVSAGIVSGQRYRQLSPIVKGLFIQTDAAINPGNSGGPLVDIEGQVIGINTAISSRSGGWQGIGFAIPIARAQWIMEELLNYGKVRAAYAGVGTTNLPYDVSKKLEVSQGALVTRVTFGYPAHNAGIQTRDVIIKFAGRQITSASTFAESVQQSPIGKPLPLTILRDGKRKQLTITLQEHPNR